MKTILVTGASGQLGKCIASVQDHHKDFNFVFADSQTLDISEESQVNTYIQSTKVDWCINCAAYTAVDQAETNVELAEKTNSKGAKYLAQVCAKHNIKIIHISTDFVFDGTQSQPYTEEQNTNPLGVYGRTKREGERLVSEVNPEHFIIRTSWLYSEFNNNFMKTMLRLGQERSELNIVSDQIGTPTYATDLANAILNIISQNSTDYGTYHYSNEGVASWYDFAKAIFELSHTDVEAFPINSEAYPTPAKRPSFSVLNKNKFKNTFHLRIPYWRTSLQTALSNLKAQQ